MSLEAQPSAKQHTQKTVTFLLDEPDLVNMIPDYIRL